VSVVVFAFVLVFPGAVVLFPCTMPAAGVVFVCPGATVLCPCAVGEVEGVLVCPGAVALFPCNVAAEGVVFVCPGATALRPCAVDTAGVDLVCPGAVALFPCETLEAAVVFCPRRAVCWEAFAVLAANTADDNAGWRSVAEGLRGLGSVASGGGPCEGCKVWVNGIPATGTKPSPPSTIANSQPRNNTNTTRPARLIHRARVPLGSSRTADPPPPTVMSGILTSRALPRRSTPTEFFLKHPRDLSAVSTTTVRVNRSPLGSNQHG
jgi:hypothetical protein